MFVGCYATSKCVVTLCGTIVTTMQQNVTTISAKGK